MKKRTAQIVLAAILVAAGIAIAAIYNSHPVTGSGTTPPTATWYPPRSDFGPVEVGTYVDRTVRLKNTGRTGNLVGTVALSPNCAGFSIQSGGGSYSLPPLASRTVVVRFTPTDTTTAYQCEIRSSP